MSIELAVLALYWQSAALHQTIHESPTSSLGCWFAIQWAARGKFLLVYDYYILLYHPRNYICTLQHNVNTMSARNFAERGDFCIHCSCWSVEDVLRMGRK